MDDSNRDGLKPKFPELPRLKIRSDVLKVARGPVFNARGDKAEPEQQPAQRVLTVEGGAPVSGSRDAKQLGAIPMQIVAETDAGTAALAMRSKCFLCVAEGTLILTDLGVMPIEQIGKETTSRKTYVGGKWHDIAAWARTGEKEVMEVTTTHGASVIVTPDHQLQTERGWIRAADLRHEFRPNGSKDSRDVVIGLEPIEGGVMADDAELEALLLGVLTGDGWQYMRDGEIYGIGFSFERDMEANFHPVLQYGAKRFNSIEKVHDADSPMRRIFWRNDEARLFASMIDKDHVPMWLWYASPECRAAYLKGLFTTDGSIGLRPRPVARFYQTSVSLVEEVRLLLRSLGIHSTVSCEVRRPRYKDLYQVVIARQKSLERFVKTIGFMDLRRQSPLWDAVADRVGRDRRSPERVRTVRLIGTRPVYDISVPGPDAFYGNGVLVHNCKNFDQATWKKLRLFWGNSSDKELFEKLNRVRMALLTTRNMEISRRSEGQDGDFDVEHAITQLGICQPLTELQGAAVIVSPISTCPDHVCSKERPTGLFTPKDREHEKMGSDAYDAIMRVALNQTKL